MFVYGNDIQTLLWINKWFTYYFWGTFHGMARIQYLSRMNYNHFPLFYDLLLLDMNFEKCHFHLYRKYVDMSEYSPTFPTHKALSSSNGFYIENVTMIFVIVISFAIYSFAQFTIRHVEESSIILFILLINFLSSNGFLLIFHNSDIKNWIIVKLILVSKLTIQNIFRITNFILSIFLTSLALSRTTNREFLVCPLVVNVFGNQS